MIYFDNTATSWPKPKCVARAIHQCLNEIGANAGRSGHRQAVKASRLVYETREVIATLFNAPDPLNVIFTQNVTEAINLALFGLLIPGNHVITSSMEHNSMMRPLRILEKQGIELSVIQCSPKGLLDIESVRTAIRSNTKLIVINHASNVVGTLQPIAECGKLAREYNLLLLVDAAQSAGAFPIDMQKDYIDLLAFTGHKALYGPTGIGGLIFGSRVDYNQVKPLKYGGTGSRSDQEIQPDFLPDRFESGTLNIIGIAGLKASIDWLNKKDIAEIRHRETMLTQKLLEELQNIPGVLVFGPRIAELQVATVSFNLKRFTPSDIGIHLDEEHSIMCRIGLHCSPASHKTIGTFPSGTVRFGLGIYNEIKEIDSAVKAIAEFAKEKR